ncbi:MAG: hypothetical protein ABI678_21675 [Kofleriaceae bacterium]
MNVAELDEVHYDLEVDGELALEQLHRRIWEKAGWATVAIAFREKDKEGTWKEPKLALLRFRRVHEVWQKQAVITVGEEEAVALGGELARWFPSISAS